MGRRGRGSDPAPFCLPGRRTLSRPALFWKGDGLDGTSIMAGSFDRPSGLKGAMHIFTADSGD